MIGVNTKLSERVHAEEQNECAGCSLSPKRVRDQVGMVEGPFATNGAGERALAVGSRLIESMSSGASSLSPPAR
jgi:hypothetical protein